MLSNPIDIALLRTVVKNWREATDIEIAARARSVALYTLIGPLPLDVEHEYLRMCAYLRHQSSQRTSDERRDQRLAGDAGLL